MAASEGGHDKGGYASDSGPISWVLPQSEAEQTKVQWTFVPPNAASREERLAEGQQNRPVDGFE
ncbi:MAG TPA: hypothetical protein VK515_07350 [Rhizomicrobium sp.]|nr:hypothetical protein [Rhizomicrobium sp.]